jgi:hypothetical protein
VVLVVKVLSRREGRRADSRLARDIWAEGNVGGSGGECKVLATRPLRSQVGIPGPDIPQPLVWRRSQVGIPGRKTALVHCWQLPLPSSGRWCTGQPVLADLPVPGLEAVARQGKLLACLLAASSRSPLVSCHMMAPSPSSPFLPPSSLQACALHW